MGTTQSSQQQDIADTLSSHAVLTQFRVEAVLTPNSGRISKTLRLRHSKAESTAVAKALWVQDDVAAHVSELERIRDATRDNPHVASFLAWFQTEPNPRNNNLRAVFLLRSHVYTTLDSRIASRPWLQHVEKVWIITQILEALRDMHQKEVCHGNVCTENVGLTAGGWVVLLDISSYKPYTNLPDDDPSLYLQYFHHPSKRCYLAPERFGGDDNTPLTPAMDVFSTGCVIMELLLNGERAMDLGELLEYRKQKSGNLQQKLNKIESSSLRAACRHMLGLEARESAATYLERIRVANPLPQWTFLQEYVQQISPDARIAIAARHYGTVLWDCMGVRDYPGEAYMKKILGPIAAGEEMEHSESKKEIVQERDLFQETDELLQQLGALSLHEHESVGAHNGTNTNVPEDSPVKEDEREERSELEKDSLLIYLQLILSTIRYVQRPASKLAAIEMVHRLATYASDEARLQRILPVTTSLLQDQDALVRARAVRLITYTVSIVESFSPSDSKIFSQYIFKRVSPLISDQALIVRLAFAESFPILAETAHRFLDITHAVRLYEAVGNGEADERKGKSESAFSDDVSKLLEENEEASDQSRILDEVKSDSGLAFFGMELVANTYKTDLANLQEIVSRWVVHIATDQSEHSSLPKRVMLNNLERLCTFFGLEGVMTFILPQILAFLNDRVDWELRAALFHNLLAVCGVIGRAATEEFVLPCLEIGLVDCEEQVISSALFCLARLVDMSLLSRSILFAGGPTIGKSSSNILGRYVALLRHPNVDIRTNMAELLCTVRRVSGSPDFDVYINPIIQPFLRHQIPTKSLKSRDALQKSLVAPWTRERFDGELLLYLASRTKSSVTATTWTAVEMKSDELNTTKPRDDYTSALNESKLRDPIDEYFGDYLGFLAKHISQSFTPDKTLTRWNSSRLEHGIEGSVKLAQSVMFPRQNGLGVRTYIPLWYRSLRDSVQSKGSTVSASSAIRSVSLLGHVYGLSIMGPIEGESIVGAADGSDDAEEETKNSLHSHESRIMEAAFSGQWGAEALLDVDVVDTCLLLTKLKALNVPPLPPDLGEQRVAYNVQAQSAKRGASALDEWRPRMNAFVASSTRESGHTAQVTRLAVSIDNSFFVSGSHDGTCRIWEIARTEDSSGILESSFTYSGHLETRGSKINDIAMLEQTHSIISGASDGSVHLWRVDVGATSKKNESLQSETHLSHRPRVFGTTNIRQLDLNEGEILAVSHFNSLSSSVCMFASQRGSIHSWDLRTSQEPFVLKHGPDLGNLTSMALGSDRNWIVSGTSKGYVVLWDIRFQSAVKLWRHSSNSAIKRLATSFVPPPQSWQSRPAVSNSAIPFVFVAAGPNECAMFDIQTGKCYESFRIVSGESHAEKLPLLQEETISHKFGPRTISSSSPPKLQAPSLPKSFNCMVGGIGAGDKSFLLTGGDDGSIRFWDFSTPSRCYTVTGHSYHHSSSYEKIDFSESERLMLCRHLNIGGVKLSSKLANNQRKPEPCHSKAILDLKIIDNALISCSRDSTVKIWR